MTFEIGMTEAIIGTFAIVLVGILVCDRLLVWWNNRVGQPDGVATWWDETRGK